MVSGLVIMADDLTGAADCTARCFSAGMAAEIFPTPRRFTLPVDRPSTPSAAAVSTDSRHLSAEDAADRVHAALAHVITALGSDVASVLWYKKIDSTLRGNIGVELDVMLDRLAAIDLPAIAVVAPAFPEQSRGLVDGFLVHADTAPRSISLPAILAKQSRYPVKAIGLESVRDRSVERKITEAADNGYRILVVDALTHEDLETIMDATCHALPHRLFCGSAGLVHVLAQEIASRQPRRVPRKSAPHSDRIVVVVGSGSTMAWRQMRELLKLDGVADEEIADDWNPHGWTPTANRIVLVHLPEPEADTCLEGENARRHAARLALAAHNTVHQLKPCCVLVAGGDTAVHILADLGVSRLSVIAELQPGIPLTVGSGPNGSEWRFVIKAGNHGDPNTLVDLVTRITA